MLSTEGNACRRNRSHRRRTTRVCPPSREQFNTVMHTHVLAPMQLIALLAQNLESTHGKLAAISSRMGSIGLTTEANGWLYRASKAALNSAVKSASVQLGRRGVVCMALSPGWVRTDMGGAGAPLAPESSVAGLRKVIAGLKPADSGKFFSHDGSSIPW